MANFPSINPTYNTKKSITPNQKIVRFADGYEHRIIFGVPEHQIPNVFQLTFNVSVIDANTIMTFLKDRMLDGASFTFTPPNGSAGQYVCDQFNEDMMLSNRSSVRATFREVFEPS